MMSVLMVSLFFVACEKDDVKVEALKVTKDAVEVVVGKSAEVEISGGVAPYTAKSADEAVVTVSVKDNKITVTAVETEAPEAQEGEAEVKPIVVTVTDAAKNEVTINVTVTVAEEGGEEEK